MTRSLLASLLLTTCFISPAQAFVGNSLNWQKLALEEKIQRKLNVALSTVIKDNQYLVEVETEVSDPGSPNFDGDNKPAGTRVSDLNLSESRGDYIAFSKIGLEVPVVDKFLDEDRTKLMNLYRFNESYDLFKNLAAIKVNVALSDKLPAELQEIARKVVNSARISVGGVKPEIKFENMALEWTDPALAKKAAEDKKEKKQDAIKPNEPLEPKIWAKDWLEWASRWGNAFGLILGALIIGYIALKLFKQWQELMEKMATLNHKKENDESPTKDQPVVSAMPQDENDKQEEEVASTHGFERFQQCLEQHPDEAVTLVRTWLNDGEDMSLLALRGLAQQAQSTEMEKLFQGLSEKQRQKWKSLLNHHLEPSDISEANRHIFQEVVRSLLVPSQIKDGELLNLIMELDYRTAASFLAQSPDQISIMLNILGPSMVSKVLAQVDESTAEKWLAKGFEYDATMMEDSLASLKQALYSYKKTHAPSPFANRLIDMISTASPDREGTLYRALAKAVDTATVMSVAKKVFPSELVLELPAAFLREIIQSYPMAKRIDLIVSREENIREMLLAAVAEKGTPARDMMDMELENVDRDPSRQSAIKARSEDIWHEFVKLSRISLSKNASYQPLADELLSGWSKKLKVNLQSVKGGRAA